MQPKSFDCQTRLFEISAGLNESLILLQVTTKLLETVKDEHLRSLAEKAIVMPRLLCEAIQSGQTSVAHVPAQNVLACSDLMLYYSETNGSKKVSDFGLKKDKARKWSNILLNAYVNLARFDKDRPAPIWPKEQSAPAP